MRTTHRILALTACLFASGAIAATQFGSCAKDPAASGVHERMDRIQDLMQRLRHMPEGEEQRRLMELHMKGMQEGLRELGHRDVGEACRVEFMHAMMEQMLRHQGAAQDSDGR